MSKYELHYAPLELNDLDAQIVVFDDHLQMSDYVYEEIINNKHNRVYLLAFENNMIDIHVSETPIFVAFVLKSWAHAFAFQTGSIFLQEYCSFQEAYKVALSMRETSKLCYKP